MNPSTYEKLAYINIINFPKNRIQMQQIESKEFNQTSNFMMVMINFYIKADFNDFKNLFKILERGYKHDFQHVPGKKAAKCSENKRRR